MEKGKLQVFMRQCNPVKLVHNMTELHIVVLQEFPAGRHVVEKVLHTEVGSGNRLHRLLELQSTAFYINICTNSGFFLLRFQLYLRHCGN